jgi:hypothetical protein
MTKKVGRKSVQTSLKGTAANSLRVVAQDIWVMLLSTIRYSMGRQTYMPTLCVDFYRRYKKALAVHQRNQIAEEVSKELDSVARVGRLLGSQCDHDAWVELVRIIREESRDGDN